jgi:hypothetical protein
MAVRLRALSSGMALLRSNMVIPSLVLISVIGLGKPQSTVRLEGVGKRIKIITSSGLEPATFQLVVQYRNRCSVPPL